MVGNQGYGDEYGIGSTDSFSILEIARMFGGKIEMLPERRGNRMIADVITEKTQALGWKTEHSVADYIEELRSMSWGNV